MPPSPHESQPHVCFVAPFGLGQKTTVWARILPLAKELVQRNWQATILIPPWDTPADAGKSWSEPVASAVPAAVQIVNVALGGGVPLIVRRLLREITARRPTIVHIVKPRAHAGLVQWSLWQRRRVGNAPIVLDIDDWEQAWSPINRYPWPLAQFLAWQEEWGIRHAHGITAASRWLVERARKYTPQTPVLYLPNGFTDLPPVKEIRSPNGDGAILFFTRFVEVSPQWLGEFTQSLYAIRPTMHLIVAGTPVQPGLDEPFRRAVAAAAPSATVEWLGFIPPVQLPALYARSTCAIFPAAPVPLQQAKCSVRLATTLLQGVPVVASAVGEQATYGADGAARLLAADAPPTAFAAAVDDVLRHPAQQDALAATARARLLDRYAWSRRAEEMIDFYTKLLQA